MQHRTLGLALFYTGVAFMFIHTTLPFLWDLTGISLAYPLVSTKGVLAILPGFSPPIGALLMFAGGLIYGRKARS